MLGDFRKIFVEKTNNEMKIPQGILDSLSINLPEGFHYENIGRGICALCIPSGAQIKGKLQIDGATQENLEKCETFEDLERYATNLQKQICILPDIDGNYFINGYPIKAQELIKKPLGTMKLVDGILRYSPAPLDSKINFNLNVNNKEIAVHTIRKPDNSIDKLRFVSNNLGGIILTFILNMSDTKMTVNVVTDLQQAGSVQNVISSIELYNSFCRGEVFVHDVALNQNNIASMTPYNQEAIEYWNQLKQLEDIFDVQFDVSTGIYEFDVIKVRELYRSLVKKEPFRTNETITKLEGNGEYETSEEVDNMVEKEMYFRFLENEKTTLMGIELHYFGIKYIFGGKVKKFLFDESTKKFETEIEVADNTEMYTSTQYFVSEREMEIFLDEEDGYRELFVNADLIEEISDK